MATISGKPYIIHNRILAQLPNEELPKCNDLYITGVTEEALFWKDVRRVLFSGSRYHILCRLNHAGLRSSWVPVKMVDVLRDIAPSLAKDVSDLEINMATQTPTSSGGDEGQRRLIAAAMDFGASLAREYGKTLNRDSLIKNLLEPYSTMTYQPDIETRREVFQAVANAVTEHVGISPDADTVARLREAAIRAVGLSLDGSIIANADLAGGTAALEDPGTIIDSEIVAIYW
jgi:hypothetical protein